MVRGKRKDELVKSKMHANTYRLANKFISPEGTNNTGMSKYRNAKVIASIDGVIQLPARFFMMYPVIKRRIRKIYPVIARKPHSSSGASIIFEYRKCSYTKGE